MYLIDTDVASELRKDARCNPGVRAFFEGATAHGDPLFVSVVTLGEIRRGAERVRRRGDAAQAVVLEQWLSGLIEIFGERTLPVDLDVALLWGKLCGASPQHPLDKLIAATALLHGFTVVTRNERDFGAAGAKVLNPFG